VVLDDRHAMRQVLKRIEQRYPLTVEDRQAVAAFTSEAPDDALRVLLRRLTSAAIGTRPGA
jgi:hypothetical protein